MQAVGRQQLPPGRPRGWRRRRTKFSTGSTGRAQAFSSSISARNLGSTGSRASMTRKAASTSSSARSTLASCSNAPCASGPCRKRADAVGRRQAACRRLRGARAARRHLPGPACRRSARRRAPSTCRSIDSTWRVVPGRSDTSPKFTRRVSVRSSEVLPALVWPTTAMRMGVSVVVHAQPSRAAWAPAHRRHAMPSRPGVGQPGLPALAGGVVRRAPNSHSRHSPQRAMTSRRKRSVPRSGLEAAWQPTSSAARAQARQRVEQLASLRPRCRRCASARAPAHVERGRRPGQFVAAARSRRPSACRWCRPAAGRAAPACGTRPGSASTMLRRRQRIEARQQLAVVGLRQGRAAAPPCARCQTAALSSANASARQQPVDHDAAREPQGPGALARGGRQRRQHGLRIGHRKAQPGRARGRATARCARRSRVRGSWSPSSACSCERPARTACAASTTANDSVQIAWLTKPSAQGSSRARASSRVTARSSTGAWPRLPPATRAVSASQSQPKEALNEPSGSTSPSSHSSSVSRCRPSRLASATTTLIRRSPPPSTLPASERPAMTMSATSPSSTHGAQARARSQFGLQPDALPEHAARVRRCGRAASCRSAHRLAHGLRVVERAGLLDQLHRLGDRRVLERRGGAPRGSTASFTTRSNAGAPEGARNYARAEVAPIAHEKRGRTAAPSNPALAGDTKEEMGASQRRPKNESTATTTTTRPTM